MKVMKNKIEKEMAIAMNTGAVAVGAVSRSSGAFPGSTEKSVSSREVSRGLERNARTLAWTIEHTVLR